MKSYSEANYGSNRTFMELKYEYKDGDINPLPVLIVPLWNWNEGNGIYVQDNIYVLIVPLWNWNVKVALLIMCLNTVLIVPLWNWNNGSRG